MYQVGKREHKHRKFWKRFGWLVGLLVVAAGIYGLMHLRLEPKQNVHNSPPVSKAYDVSSAKKVHIDKPILTMDLPAGWTEAKLPASPTAPAYEFRSKSQDAQVLDIYIDNPPPLFGINRAIAVSVSGSGLQYESVSENCTSYTDITKRGPTGGIAPAKWQGMDFYCDVANYARAVVGTVSHDGINYLSVTTPTQGVHKIFITYTDNNISPDYSTLYDILNSVQFK